MDPFLGQIIMFGGNFAPRGWALCDGQLLPISQYSALFSILGTTYGGDGRTTFALPDLRGRLAMHPGNGAGLSPRRLGERTGAENVTLTTAQMPAHHHSVSPQSVKGPGDSNVPENTYPAEAFSEQIYSHGPANAHMASQDTTNTGGGQAFGIVQPGLCVNFIIALQGTFPSRN